ncbi:MAG: hypothetical protein PVJ57_18280 [Phycisphaerae bacterium]|jgi:hypothetical protein
MAKKGPVSIVEMHVEKAALGLGVLALAAMAFLYLVRSPNVIEYNGTEVGADDIDQAIRQAAEGLDAAVRNAKPPAVEVPKYAEILREQHDAGILGTEGATPAVAAALPLAVDFGLPVKELQDEEAAGDIALVTPLKPSPPVLRTGRSEVVERPVVLGTALAGGPDTPALEGGDNQPKPVELPWVTVAAYFPRKTQQQEMTKANYASYRTRVYLAGTDVQRQEMLASGEWSNWQDVNGSKAMPKLDIPDPQFDEVTGEITNGQELKDAFTLVKNVQKTLIQPEFPEVESGDFWEIPALAGYEEEEEEEEPELASTPPKSERTRNVVAPPPRRGGGAIGIGGGGGAISVGGGGGGRSSGGAGAARAAREARKEGEQKGREDLAAANTAARQKNYNEAQAAAQRVIDNEHARSSDKTRAKKILRIAEKKLAQMQKASGAGGGGVTVAGGPVTVAGGPSGITVAGAGRGRNPALGNPAAPTGQRTDVNMVTHPKDPEQVAVWFHDDTVEAGKTYRYRMRVRLWNRYVGQLAALKDPSQAKQSELVGEWSLPSQSIQVTPSSYFFAKGPTLEKDGARVEVFKWHKGNWLSETFDVRVGDVIGGVKKTETGEYDENFDEIREDVDFTTGAIVLDLQFEEPAQIRVSAGKEGQFRLRDDDSLVVVYLDPADGQVKRRLQAADRYDPIYTRLKDEL